ncbi:MAG: enoyl-CoA hydratase-related protein, partial [Myxococcota bacterium]
MLEPLPTPTPQPSVSPKDERTLRSPPQAIVDGVARFLGAGSAAGMNLDVPLVELGLDSLGAAELSAWLSGHGIQMGQGALLQGTTCRQLIESEPMAAKSNGHRDLAAAVAMNYSARTPAPTAIEDKPQASSTNQRAPSMMNVMVNTMAHTHEQLISGVAGFLGASSAAGLDVNVPLVDLGLDSLGAAELSQWLSSTYGLQRGQAEILQGVSLSNLISDLDLQNHRPPKESSYANETPTELYSPRAAVVRRAESIEPSPPKRVEAMDRVGVRTIFVDPHLKCLPEVAAAVEAGDIVVLRAPPGQPHFCLGADLSSMRFDDGSMDEVLLEFGRCIEVMQNASQPIIVLVEGPCRGGGMVFPCLGTVVLATHEATFGFPEVRRGGLPGLVSVAAQRKLSLSACKYYMVFGDIFDAARAQALGLVNFVADATGVERELQRLLARLATIDRELVSAAMNTCPLPTVDQALLRMGQLARRDIGDSKQPSKVITSYDEATGVGRLELNDLEFSNTLSTALSRDLLGGIDILAGKPGLRAVIFQGTGANFCPGGNPHHLRQIQGKGTLSAVAEVAALSEGLVGLRRLSVPVICAVHGKVVGGGLALMLNADYLIASADTSFNFGNLPRGMSCIGLLSENLVRAVGERWAKRLYLRDETVSATQAKAIGLINAVRADKAGAQAAARSLAEAIAQHPARGVATMLDLLRPTIDRERLARECVGLARTLARGDISADSSVWHAKAPQKTYSFPAAPDAATSNSAPLEEDRTDRQLQPTALSQHMNGKKAPFPPPLKRRRAVPAYNVGILSNGGLFSKICRLTSTTLSAPTASLKGTPMAWDRLPSR